MLALSFFLILVYSSLSWAQEEILIITSSKEAIYSEFAAHLKNQLIKSSNRDIQVQITSLESVDGNRQLDHYSLVIAAGQRAAEHVLTLKQNTNLLLTFIPSRVYFENMNERYACNTITCSYLFLDQPPRRQFKLLRILFPERKSIGMLTISKTDSVLSEYQRAAKQLDFKLVPIPVSDTEQVVDALQENIHEIEILLSRPDPRIYNQNTAKGILLTTYYNRVPLLAYSSSFVKSGATAGLYSSLEDLARHAAEAALKQHDKHVKTPHYEYPKYFRVEVNTKVGDSLNLDLPPIEKVLESLHDGDKQ